MNFHSWSHLHGGWPSGCLKPAVALVPGSGMHDFAERAGPSLVAFPTLALSGFNPCYTPLRGGASSSIKNMQRLRERDRDVPRCQVEDCQADLSTMKEYHQRYKICEHHLKVDSIMRGEQVQRFCQQCGRFHGLEEFDDQKRSCRERLRRHNERRRRKGKPSDYSVDGRSGRAQDFGDGDETFEAEDDLQASFDPPHGAYKKRRPGTYGWSEESDGGGQYATAQRAHSFPLVETARPASKPPTVTRLCHATPSTGLSIGDQLSCISRSASQPVPSNSTSTWRTSVTTESVQRSNSTTLPQPLVETDMPLQAAPLPTSSAADIRFRSPFENPYARYAEASQQLEFVSFLEEPSTSRFPTLPVTSQIRCHSLPNLSAAPTREVVTQIPTREVSTEMTFARVATQPSMQHERSQQERNQQTRLSFPSASDFYSRW